MSATTQITEQLPYLRRFARSLSGSQQSGDNYVAAMLEAMIADKTTITQTDELKETLYRSLLKMWSSFDINLRHNVTDMPHSASRNLQAITPLPRQAFLLKEVEGFANEQIARILETDLETVTALLADAAKEMAAQVATSVLIIEDEPLIAMDIEDMVVSLGHTVTAIARTHDEAVEAISKQKPGLVLADIQLADGSSGIDAVNEILTEISVPVVFITAFPERLLTGERPEPAYLVTKPFQPAQVSALISQALFFGETASEAA